MPRSWGASASSCCTPAESTTASPSTTARPASMPARSSAGGPSRSKPAWRDGSKTWACNTTCSRLKRSRRASWPSIRCSCSRRPRRSMRAKHGRSSASSSRAACWWPTPCPESSTRIAGCWTMAAWIGCSASCGPGCPRGVQAKASKSRTSGLAGSLPMLVCDQKLLRRRGRSLGRRRQDSGPARASRGPRPDRVAQRGRRAIRRACEFAGQTRLMRQLGRRILAPAGVAAKAPHPGRGSRCPGLRDGPFPRRRHSIPGHHPGPGLCRRPAGPRRYDRTARRGPSVRRPRGNRLAAAAVASRGCCPAMRSCWPCSPMRCGG